MSGPHRALCYAELLPRLTRHIHLTSAVLNCGNVIPPTSIYHFNILLLSVGSRHLPAVLTLADKWQMPENCKKRLAKPRQDFSSTCAVVETFSQLYRQKQQSSVQFVSCAMHLSQTSERSVNTTSHFSSMYRAVSPKINPFSSFFSSTGHKTLFSCTT